MNPKPKIPQTNPFLTPQMQQILEELSKIDPKLKESIQHAEIQRKTWYQWHSFHFKRELIPEIQSRYFEY